MIEWIKVWLFLYPTITLAGCGAFSFSYATWQWLTIEMFYDENTTRGVAFGVTHGVCMGVAR